LRLAALILSPIILLTFIACSQVMKSKRNTELGKAQTLLWSADWSADDKLIAIGGDDSLLRIFDGKYLKQMKTYRINSMIRQVSWHPKNNSIAIATAGNQVSILNTESGKFIKLEGVTNGARAIGWNFNGELLATADNEGLIKIWDVKGNLLRVIKKEDTNSYFSLHWHPYKNIIAVSGDDIRIVDTSGTTLNVIKHRKENTGILAIRWHPEGEFFSTGDYGHDQEGVKSILQFWKPDGTLMKTIYGSKAEYRNIQWNKEGTQLATASDALRIWNKNGDLLFSGIAEELLWGLDWNSKSDHVITTSINGRIKLWNAQAKSIMKTTE